MILHAGRGNDNGIGHGIGISFLLAESVKQMGRAEAIRQAEQSGILTMAKRYREQEEDAKRQRRDLPRRDMMVLQLALIPVPSIQRAMIEETLKDEIGLARKLAPAP